MSEKISEYTTSVTALASGDLMDVSKLISTSPLEYQSQKLNYSVLLTELNADLSITLQSAYNASTQPQILTSVAKGGVVIRSGQALDTNSVLELKNIAGSSTFVVGGNGIVANGDWQATAIAAAFGGTGQTSYAIGDLIYASNTTAIAKLGIGTSGQVLTVSGGGIPTWAAVSSSNLGSANLTSADDARTFTLKSGGTATQNLQFLNSGGGNLLKLSGNKAIDFGSSANTIKPKIYLDAYAPDKFSLFSNVSAFSFCDIYSSGHGNFDLKNAAGNTKIGMQAGVGGVYTETAIMSLYGPYSSYRIYNSIGNNVVDLRSGNSETGEFYLNNSSGTNKIGMVVGGSIIDTSLKVGGSFGGATAALQIVGAGATSSTKTALFQNSASVAALTIKDDGYCIIKANNAAIASGDLSNNEMSFYIDEGTNHCVVKVKYSSGTVKTGTFNLT
jgi:hypothetical protein